MPTPDEFRTLLDHAQDVIFVLDADGEILYANAAVERILGLTSADLRGEDAFEYVHPDDQLEARETFQELIETGDAGEVEHRTLATDGSWVWLQSRMGGSTDADLDGYVVSSRAVTDRKAAEAARAATSTQLEEIAASTDDLLWLFTADWDQLLFANDAYEELWGMPLADVYEDPLAFLEGVHPDDRERVVDAMQRVSGGERTEVEFRVNPDRDFRVWVWAEGVPVVEDGEVVRAVGFARDVTDRRRRERQLRVMDRLLRHNIRNDMNVVLGHAELAGRTDDESVGDSMAIVVETAEDLLHTAEKQREIINVLSNTSRRRRLDVVPLVREAVETTRAAHPDATVELSAPATAEASAIPELRLAVEELLENAVLHAATSSPTVSAAVTTTDGGVEIAVTDECPPIPENEFEVLDDEEPTQVSHGTGVGLWMVYYVVDFTDGSIAFSRTETGNRVEVALPRPAD